MDEERKELILSVAKYTVLTGFSTRKIASVFHVSNYTIHSILTNQLLRLCEETKKKEHIELYKEVQEILKSNKALSIEDNSIKTRVLEAAKLLIQGKKVSEIGQILNTSFYTVYRDLTVRLPKIKDIDEDLISKVKETLNQNKELNLELGRIMKIDDEHRDEKGKFI